MLPIHVWNVFCIIIVGQSWPLISALGTWTNHRHALSCQNDTIFTILLKEENLIFLGHFLINHISDKFNSSHAANTCLECFLYHRCRSVVTNLISALGAIGQITDTPWVAKMHHETPIEHKVEISILFTSRHRLAWSTLMFRGIWCVLLFFFKEVLFNGSPSKCYVGSFSIIIEPKFENCKQVPQTLNIK